ncbi:unnamed protein product [Blepharisma stoltei]|uniref:Vesicle transport protein n=1 Tax=Blepharisma stoltei TaxID=1481888 RepID=A0AAU9K925_9CILI|nr:unnamed protein product [Blepharisma stoltei]
MLPNYSTTSPNSGQGQKQEWSSSIKNWLTHKENKNEETGLLSNIAQAIKNKASESVAIFQTAEDRAVRIRKSLICLIIAVILLFGSLSFLPTFILFPKNFAILFSAGSLFIHAALSFTKPTFLAYFKELFEGKENIIVSCVYFSSITCTLFAALILGDYVIVIFSTAFQILGLGWYISNMFPGGYTGFLNLIKYGFKMCPCFSGEAFLPI